MKELTRVGKKMVYGLIGIKMDRRSMKELTRMGNCFLTYVGMRMGGYVNVIIMGMVVNNSLPTTESQ